MQIEKTEIEGVYVVKPKVFGDARGYFFESFNRKAFCDATGIDIDFVQDNESRSCYGVVRGLHFQRPPYAQSKLVRVVQGEVLDVAVDLRRQSPTYGHHVAVRLSADDHTQLFLPKGMAHGFAVLSEVAVFQYKCDAYYTPSSEDAVAWDDPTLAINWLLPANEVILSEKDKHHQSFDAFCRANDYF